MAEPKLDWQQVVMNGGPACFALLDDEAGWYCGRAQRWEGHDCEHKYVSLEDLTASLRVGGLKRAVEIVSGLPIDNSIPNFTRASAFKKDAILALTVLCHESAAERGIEQEDGRCPDCGGTEPGSCFYCKTD